MDYILDKPALCLRIHFLDLLISNLSFGGFKTNIEMTRFFYECTVNQENKGKGNPFGRDQTCFYF